MNDNPFTSVPFTSIWLKHFSPTTSETYFGFIPNLSFIKHHILPLYTNICKNNTKGISYAIDSKVSDYRKKVFLIYDIPEYFNNSSNFTKKQLALKKIKQYPGFLIDFKQYENLDDYLKKVLASIADTNLKRIAPDLMLHLISAQKCIMVKLQQKNTQKSSLSSSIY